MWWSNFTLAKIGLYLASSRGRDCIVYTLRLEDDRYYAKWNNYVNGVSKKELNRN
jgi:hypothetical protein